MTEEDKAKEYRDLIQKKPKKIEDDVKFVPPPKAKDEWVCLKCGHIYFSLKAAMDCKCKEIFRRNHDVQLQL